MKKLCLLTLLLVSFSVSSQTDSLKYLRLDSLTPEQLQQYYINEPEPIQFYKGPDVGDSIYYVLDPLAIPTKTVEGEPLSYHGEGLSAEPEPEEADTSRSDSIHSMRPKVSLGTGLLAFHGDLYKNH